MKTFNTMRNVGTARYVINHHDGVKKHDDGSAFFGITICRNKRDFDAKCRSLRIAGYMEQ